MNIGKSKRMKLYFVGAGKMATALATGIVREGLFPTDELCACDVNELARAAFTEATGIVCEASASAALSEAEVVLLAVKPQVAEAAVKALPPRRDGVLVISICAGLPIGKLSSWFGTEKIVRVMPNTPLMVGRGASCYALGPGADETSAQLAGAILGSLGLAYHVEESQLDAVTALSGSGPAYFFEMIKAMTDAGVKAGLDEDLSLSLSVQTMVGAGEMLSRKLGTPDQLRDAVTSPKGTTAEGLAVMATWRFREMMEEVVAAAKRRSIELGRGE